MYKINGNKEKTKDPKLPDIVLFGLIFVNFFPPINLPIKYPPVSENIQIRIIKIILLEENHTYYNLRLKML